MKALPQVSEHRVCTLLLLWNVTDAFLTCDCFVPLNIFSNKMKSTLLHWSERFYLILSLAVDCNEIMLTLLDPYLVLKKHTLFNCNLDSKHLDRPIIKSDAQFEDSSLKYSKITVLLSIIGNRCGHIRCSQLILYFFCLICFYIDIYFS